MTTTPLWRDTEHTYPTADFPADQRFDVAVVGAGFTGLTTALFLAAEGRSVVVLESRDLGAGASGATTAKASVLQGVRVSTIRKRHGLDTARSYATANRYGLDWWADFCATHGVATQRPRAVTYARGVRGVGAIWAELRTLEELGYPARWCETLDVPFPARAAVELPDQLQLDPMAALVALAGAVAEAGGRLVEATRVTGLRVRGTGEATRVEVRTHAGTLTAADVVLCTASPALDRGITAATMEAERSYLCAFDFDGDLAEGMYASVESPVRSLRTATVDGRQVLLVGGNGHRTGTAAPIASKLDSLREFAAEYFPGARPTHGWSAQDFHPVTLLPRAGRLPWGRGHVHFAGGYSKWGLTGAPAAARIVADGLLGRSSKLSFGRPTVSGTARSAVPMFADLPAQLTAAAVEAAVRRPRPRLLPTGRATGPDGRPCEVSLVCPHMGAALAWNPVEESWDCPWHGSRFSPCGELLEGPATSDLTRRDGDSRRSGR
ncbi:MAG TPA: FAD-dependent oxidoreductase [Actinomycetales bacterium]|nr:FAD-dependent oxidoreductase [Actinomycetales bacterium]